MFSTNLHPKLFFPANGSARRFDTGQQISVKVMNGCIVLMVYGEQEQRLQDELQEAHQKLNRIESTLATLQ